MENGIHSEGEVGTEVMKCSKGRYPRLAEGNTGGDIER